MAGYWHRDPDLRSLASVWHLATSQGSASVFQEFAFARQWARVFAPLTEIAVWVSQDPPWVAPFALRNERLELIGEGLFDYLDVIGATSSATEGAAADAALRLPWRQAQFTGVPQPAVHPTFWRRLAVDARPYAGAPLRAARAQLDGQHPRLELRWRKAGAELHLASAPHERRRLLAWLLDHKARALAARGQANVLGPREQAWLVAMVELEPESSELWRLERGGRTLSALLAWRNRTVRYGYTLSYDQDAAEHSPGILLLHAVLRHTMIEGRSFNFLTGEQAYKQRFATHSDALARCLANRG